MSAAPEKTTPIMTEETSPEKSTSTITEEKATATVHSENLPPPAVASPPSRQRLHLLPMKWGALLILQLAIIKATTTRRNFWLSMAATIFIVATLMAVPSERLRARETPLWRAVLDAWCGRYRREIDNFWNILDKSTRAESTDHPQPTTSTTATTIPNPPAQEHTAKTPRQPAHHLAPTARGMLVSRESLATTLFPPGSRYPLRYGLSNACRARGTTALDRTKGSRHVVRLARVRGRKSLAHVGRHRGFECVRAGFPGAVSQVVGEELCS
jgi:hypothetical protein